MLFGRHQCRTISRLERQNWIVFGNTLYQRIESTWWWTDGIRVERFPRIHYMVNSQWDSKHDDRIKVWTWAVSRKDHWHYMEVLENSAANPMNFSYAIKFPFGCWLWESVYGIHVNKPNEIMMLNFAESGHPMFQATSLLGRREQTIHYNWSEETRWMIRRTVILSISSVSTEQSQMCATNYIEILMNVRSVNRWWYRRRVPTLTPQPHLRAQHHRHKVTSCKITNGNSQNSWKSNLMLCRHYVENTLILEISQRPDREGGFVQIRRSAQSWLWNSIIWRTSLHWYHDRIIFERPNSFVGSTCEWHQQIRHRNVRRKYPVKMLIRPSALGNLWHKPSRDQNKSWICLPIRYTNIRSFLFWSCWKNMLDVFVIPRCMMSSRQCQR